jgi:acyl-CoA synthetase (AMP-forming)/AMP-acid ligase II
MDVAALLSRSVARFGARVALEGPQGDRASASLTFAELGERVDRLANALLGLGLNPGDRVLDLQPNQLSYVETDLACCAAGLIRVALNHRLHPDDWARIADDSGATALIYDARYADAADSLRSGLGPARVVVVGDGPDTAYQKIIDTARTTAPAVDRAPDDLVSLNYTSGTTGRPKGVRRSHRNRWASLVNMTFDVLAGVPLPGDVYLHAGPITHTSGLFVLPFLAAGARQLILPTFDPESVADAVVTRRVTHTALVPTMVSRLLAHGEPLTRLKMLGYAGAPMPPELIRRAYHELTPFLVQYYGLVEAIPPVTVLDAADHGRGLTGAPELLTSAGRAALGVALRVVDEEGRALPPGEVGEVVTRGDHVMSGYWSGDAGSVKTVDDGGWLHTGDLGRLDESGRLWLVDRKGDMIITGGYNVYPREVEEVIAEVPGVDGVAVVGVADPDWGQRVVALFGGSAETAAVDAHCRARLAPYKKPKEVRRVEAFPLNATGKIAKNVLRAELESPDER